VRRNDDRYAPARVSARHLNGICDAPLHVMSIKSFHDLDVWQLSMQLAQDTYRLVQRLPADERFGLALQLRRAAVSIPSNIAEGFGYGTNRRYVHHLRIAMGSDSELQTQLALIEKLSLAPASEVRPLSEQASKVGRMLNGLIRALVRHRARTASSPRSLIPDP
jgi:four helix bundle protein